MIELVYPPFVSILSLCDSSVHWQFFVFLCPPCPGAVEKEAAVFVKLHGGGGHDGREGAGRERPQAGGKWGLYSRGDSGACSVEGKFASGCGRLSPLAQGQQE